MLGPLLLAGISGNYERLYGHWGILPRAYALDRVYWPAFLFIMKSDPAWIWWIFWATVAASLCLALGLWTRIAAAATFFLYVATIQRNLLSFNGECGILGFALLALAMAPTPQPFSARSSSSEEAIIGDGGAVAGTLPSDQCLHDVLFHDPGENRRRVGYRHR